MLAQRLLYLCVFLCLCVLLNACAQSSSTHTFQDKTSTLIHQSKPHYVEELDREIRVFENVAVGLGLPLRKYLNNEQAVSGKSILDLGTGTGVLSIIALHNGASLSVATEINAYAVENARYNAQLSGFEDKIDVRPVSMDKPGAYSVIDDNERFDLIVSNPPQGKDVPESIYDYSHSDPELAFFRSILAGLKDHLTPDGKGVFALYYRTLSLAQQTAGELGLQVNVLLNTKNRNGLYYLVEIKPIHS